MPLLLNVQLSNSYTQPGDGSGGQCHNLSQIVPEIQFIGLSQLEPACSTLVLDAEGIGGIKVPKGTCSRLCFIDLVYIGSSLLQHDRLQYSKTFPTILGVILDRASQSSFFGSPLLHIT